MTDSEDSVDADSSSTSSEEERPKVVRNPPVFQAAETPAGFNLWQHRKLKTLHLMSVENQSVFHVAEAQGPYTRNLTWHGNLIHHFAVFVSAEQESEFTVKRFGEGVPFWAHVL